MIKRIYGNFILKKLDHFPIVSILGPRQCGKTTLIRSTLPSWKYVDLERPSDYTPFSEDPEARLDQLDKHVILDEAQRLPKLFPVLRSHVDRRRTVNGQFTILGSASPSLIREISESLAGRTAFIELTPFLLKEIFPLHKHGAIKRLWFHGGFPDPYLMDDPASLLDWFEGYTRTFIERDLTSMGIEISGPLMRRLWTMIAHCNGGLWNASQLASSLGVNYQTVNRYADILEQTYLVRKLYPYYTNIGKRIVKSPKIYIRDSGLLHYFLGIHHIEQIESHPSRGASWEAFIIEQLCSLFQLVLPGPQFFFWRTAGGAEVDLLIEVSGKLIPFEIKLHSSPDYHMIKGLVSCMTDLNLSRGYVVYPGKESYSLGHNVTVIPVEDILLSDDPCQIKSEN